MAIDEKKLKPCPHCGGSASISVDLEATRDTEGRLWAYTAVCNRCCATSGLCYSTDMAIASWNKRTSDKWIPCSERLPNESGAYLVTVNDYAPETVEAYYYSKTKVWGEIEGCDTWHYVKAWMPLPPAYEGAE